MALGALPKFLRMGIKLHTTLRYYSVQKLSRNFLVTPKRSFDYSGCRSLCTPQHAPKNFYENLEKIQEDAATNHRIGRALFMNVLKDLGNHQTNRENVLFLLKSCMSFFPDLTQAERSELTGKIWTHLNEQEVPTLNDYITLLQVRRKNRQCILDYKEFLKDLRIPVCPEIYEELLYVAAECNLIDQVFKILAEMKELKYPATETVFNALILAHSRNRDLKNVELVLETMSAANVEQTPATVTEIIKAYLENGNVERAMGMLGKDSFLLSTEQLVTIVRTALNNNVDPSLVSIIVKHFSVDILNKKQIHSVMRNLLTELIYEDKITKALDVMNSLPTPVIHAHEDVDGYGSFLINDMIKKGCSAEDIVLLCKNLVDSKRNPRALHVAIEIAHRRESPVALELLRELSKSEELKPHYFWPLTSRAFTTDGEQGILNIITEMTKLGVSPDADTINLYLLPRLTIILKNTKTAVKILEDCGVKMSQLLTPLTSNLLIQKRFEEAYETAKAYQSKVDCEALVPALVISYPFCTKISLLAKIIALMASKAQTPFDVGGRFLVEIITSRTSSISHEYLSKILKEFFLCGVKISQTAADVIDQYLSKWTEKELAVSTRHDLKRIIDRKMERTVEAVGQHITHPRDMTLEELECHLVELEAKKLNTRGVLRRLLQLNVQKNKLDRALEVKKLCDERKVDLSPGMLASIFDLHVKTKNLKDAEWTWLELKKKYPGFAVDEHKVIDFASLLVEQGFPAEAKKVLTMRATTRVRGGAHNLKNLWNLLNNVARHVAKTNGPEGETRAFLKFLVDLNYGEYHNTVLGPVVREFILRKDLPKAVEEFKEIAERFKKTPLKLELMTLILEVSNGKYSSDEFGTTQDQLPKMMEEVMAVVSKIHGTPNAQLTLIFALAEGGTDSQLRKLLIDPQIKINQEMFQKQCDYLSNEHKVEPLIRLARCTRGLGYLIREQDMYRMLLNSFVRENNYEAALLLFNRIAEEDELKLSREFVQNLTDLLDRNNIEIPTRLALHGTRSSRN